MRVVPTLLCATLLFGSGLDAQTRKTTPRKTPAKAARKAPPPVIAKIEAEWKCPSELGVGVATKRRFCDVLTGADSKDGILITIPPHRGPLTMTFDLHNRHTYSEELIKARQAYRKYTATIGVLTMDNTLIDRAIVQSEFRTLKDLFDRIGGGAGPGGVKAVAPAAAEPITITIPEAAEEMVAILGEKLSVVRPDGENDAYSAPGRPIATISNVNLEFTLGPPPKAPKKAPVKKPPF